MINIFMAHETEREALNNNVCVRKSARGANSLIRIFPFFCWLFVERFSDTVQWMIVKNRNSLVCASAFPPPLPPTGNPPAATAFTFTWFSKMRTIMSGNNKQQSRKKERNWPGNRRRGTTWTMGNPVAARLVMHQKPGSVGTSPSFITNTTSSPGALPASFHVVFPSPRLCMLCGDLWVLFERLVGCTMTSRFAFFVNSLVQHCKLLWKYSQS